LSGTGTALHADIEALKEAIDDQSEGGPDVKSAGVSIDETDAEYKPLKPEAISSWSWSTM